LTIKTVSCTCHLVSNETMQRLQEAVDHALEALKTHQVGLLESVVAVQQLRVLLGDSLVSQAVDLYERHHKSKSIHKLCWLDTANHTEHSLYRVQDAPHSHLCTKIWCSCPEFLEQVVFHDNLMVRLSHPVLIPQVSPSTCSSAR